MTVITAGEQEITATYDIDISATDISREELSTSHEEGNHPLPEGLAERILHAMQNNELRLTKLP